MILSTGEMSPAQKAAEAGKGIRPGAEMRLPALSFASDAATMWPAHHDAADHNTLWREIHGAMRRHHGTAGRAFLAMLVQARAAGEAELRDAITETRGAFLAAHLPAAASEQARTVAMRFALVAVAGEMAMDRGVLPWPQGEATRAAAAGLAAWLSDWDDATSSEDAKAVQAVRSFIEKHGEARSGLIRQHPEGRRIRGIGDRPVTNRAGWRIQEKGGVGWRYFILPDVWRSEVCSGLNLPTPLAPWNGLGF